MVIQLTSLPTNLTTLMSTLANPAAVRHNGVVRGEPVQPVSESESPGGWSE